MAILLTGVAGFIGFHTAAALLARGEDVIGIDNLNDYYDVRLKRGRLKELEDKQNFHFHQLDLGDIDGLKALARDKKIDRIIHLAAQAGVRYSIENPQAYVASILIGHSNILELARQLEVKHMVYASSSSVYGGNRKTPFSEADMTDDPVSFYGATKKSNELLSNSYARLYNIPLTGLRFFTVYGAWGRPDMAYWIFSEKITTGQSIRIFNNGRMGRDFTFVSDAVDGVLAALDKSAVLSGMPVPHRVYNIGNDHPEELMSLVQYVEQGMGQEADKVFEEMQKGDVVHTWADISRAKSELGYAPKVPLKEGIAEFANWYKASAFFGDKVCL